MRGLISSEINLNNQRLFFLEDLPKDRTYNNSGSRVSGRSTSGQRFCQTLSADDLGGGESLIPMVGWYRLFFVSVLFFFGLESEALTIIHRDIKMSETILFDRLVKIL